MEPKGAYSLSLDMKLSELKGHQEDLYRISHLLWEAISVLNNALSSNVSGIGYEIYFQLVRRKIIEFGIANIVVDGRTLRDHVNDLEEKIEKRRNKK